MISTFPPFLQPPPDPTVRKMKSQIIPFSVILIYTGLFGLSGEGVKGSEVELAENKQILSQFCSILTWSKQTIEVLKLWPILFLCYIVFGFGRYH